jgi:uncharacterized protein YkwD
MKRAAAVIIVFAVVAFSLAAGGALRAERAGLAAQTGARASGVGGCRPAPGWGSLKKRSAERVLVLVNAHRRSLGLRPLHVIRSLERSARWKALHMARYLYLAHDDPAPPVARSPAERIAACGFAGGAWGENIAYGYPTPRAVVDGWLASPGHRANIENPIYRTTGIGVAARKGEPTFWAQDFGS